MKQLSSNNLAACTFFGIITILLLGLMTPAILDRLKKMRADAVAAQNCGKVMFGMRLFATDNSGGYPDWDDPSSSNTAFRLLFKEGVINDESIFGCPTSPFKPDGKIGTAPSFSEALQPGENHWAMTRHLSDSSDGDCPLVYENPVHAEWPPTWTAQAHKRKIRAKGDSWSSGRIIIGLNDLSITMMNLEPHWGNPSKVAPDATGKNIFEAAIHAYYFPKGEILDVEVE